MKTKAKIALATTGLFLTLLLLLFAGGWVRSGSDDHPQPLWTVGFSPDGKTLVTGGGAFNPSESPALGELIFWDATSGTKRVVPDSSGIRSIAWSPDGKFIAIGQKNGSTKLVRPADGKILVNMTPRSALVNAVAVSGDSKLVASAGFDGTVILWDVPSRHEETLVLESEKLLNVAISRDRSALVATARSGKAYLFDLAHRGQHRMLWAGPASARAKLGMENSSVEAVAFAPDGTIFATGCQTAVKLWDAESGAAVRELKGFTGEVLGVAFSPDGGTLACVDSTGTLSLWDVQTGERLQRTQAHGGRSFGIAFSPDGRRLATVGLGDYTLRIWNSQTLAPMATYRRAVFKLQAQ